MIPAIEDIPVSVWVILFVAILLCGIFRETLSKYVHMVLLSLHEFATEYNSAYADDKSNDKND